MWIFKQEAPTSISRSSSRAIYHERWKKERKKWNKLQAVAVTAAMTVSIAMTGMTAMAEATDDSKKIADGDVTLTIFCDFPSSARAYYTDMGDNPVVKKMEEETGLNFKFIHALAGDDGSFFQQLLASGDLPDLMFTNLFQTNYPGGVEGAIQDGVLSDLT